MPKICLRYAKDMTTCSTVLTKRLPDKTSKPVRLKKMSHKSVLTKRLPDKTSKVVLTKPLPDKTSADLLQEFHLSHKKHLLNTILPLKIGYSNGRSPKWADIYKGADWKALTTS